MAKSSKQVMKILQQAGWQKVRQAGSHVQFKHPDFPFVVTLPHPKKDLSIGLIRDIAKKTGLKL